MMEGANPGCPVPRVLGRPVGLGTTNEIAVPCMGLHKVNLGFRPRSDATPRPQLVSLNRPIAVPSGT